MNNPNIRKAFLELISELNGRDLDSFVDMIKDAICEDDIDLFIFIALFLSQKVGCPLATKHAIQLCDSWIQAGASEPNEVVREQITQWPSAPIPIVDRIIALYSNTRDSSYLRDAISLYTRKLESVPTADSCWAKFVKTLYDALVAKVKAMNTYSNPRTTIEFIDTTSFNAQGHLSAELWSAYSAEVLNIYTLTNNIVHLERAILFCRTAIKASHDEDSDLNERKLLLGNCLTKRFYATEAQDDLNEAILFLTSGLDGISPDGATHLESQAQLASCLLDRHIISRDQMDLGRASDISSRMVTAASEHHPDYHHYLYISGICFYHKYIKSSDEEHYALSIEGITRAIDLRPDENCYNYVAHKVFSARYLRTRHMTSLDSAMASIKAAYESDNVMYGLDMAKCLQTRSKETGCAEDLDRAIEIATHLLQVKEGADNKTASIYHLELARMLDDRYEMVGSLADLDNGIDLAEKATHLNNQNTRAQHHLSLLLVKRFYRTEQLVADINRAIVAAEAASDEHNGGTEVAFSQYLAKLLLIRHDNTKSEMDLDRACQLLTTNYEADASTLMNASRLLMYWFYRAESFRSDTTKEGIKSRIECLRKALTYLPSGHFQRARILFIIVNITTIDFSGQNVEEEIDRAKTDLIECWNCRAAPLHIRMSIVNRAAAMATPKETCSLLREAIGEFPKLLPRSLSNDDRQSLLEIVSNIASNAAYYHLRAGEDPATAVGFLEAGRSVLSNILMEMRTDTSDLREAYPDLAQRFASLVEVLDSTIQSLQSDIGSLEMIQPVKWESNASQRRKADTEFTTLLDEIRTKPGFEGFLLPLKPEDMMRAADPDPIVVINLHVIESHAFIIESHQIRVITLPDLTRSEVERRTGKMRSILGSGSHDIKPLLKWLWNVLCLPCLKELRFDHPVTDGEWPRVWWIPTGGLSQFPLHAAGVYEGSSTDTVLDCVMSSYAVSINTLQHGRRLQTKPASGSLGSKKALLVSMQSTPGQSKLRFADEEVNNLFDYCPQLELNPVKPECTRSGVVEHLKNCHIFHFAGHGSSHPKDPSKSLLLLRDWQTEPLTVGDLRETRLQEHPPFLGYLSACSTGSNQKASLLDEGIHLVGALQLSGFQHVVGSLWAVSDRHSADVARCFYEVLKREGNPPFIRSSSFNYPVDEESTEMLYMKLNLLAEKLAQREKELTVMAAEFRKKLSGNISDAERKKEENKASAACERIRDTQSEYQDLWQLWYFKIMQDGNEDGNKLEQEYKKNETMRLEQEERWEMLERTSDYFKTRWG
ncbi:hypothetical protein FAUST_8771 [Fusarium austroamericanum]|uniref:CHAT domain-containing protein n=1 Tax=Fusarium austroamericanum TaxID=282268 RepID=A0AAN5Z638_FUSAU|nr:hypothetical protein FAUST_8771 [Fusarium austroamericanum]